MSSSSTADAVAPASARWWAFDFEAVTSAAPVLVLIVVGALRKGGFFTPDVVVLPCLCLALALVSPVVLRWVAVHPLPVTAGAAATGWWLVEAAIWKHDVESWRMPATWVCAAAGYGVTRALPWAARRVVAFAVTLIGFALSSTGLVVVAIRSTAWTWPDERSLRFQGPLTYPSAIGLYLLVALLASVEVWPGRAKEPGRLPAVVRTLILLGVFATDSRSAIVGLVVLLCFRSTRRVLGIPVVSAVIAAPALLYGQRDGVQPLLIVLAVLICIAVCCLPEHLLRKGVGLLSVPALIGASWLLVTQHHTVSGFDASWTERGHILRGAARVVTAHPVFGAGPDAWIPTKMLAGQPGVDAFAHNEPLEILLSLGALGTAVVLLAATILARTLATRRGPLAVPVLAVAGVAGLFDFVLHFPAVGLLCGVVAALGIQTGQSRVTFDRGRTQ